MLLGTSVEKALQSFGLTKKEAQIYIFLAKHGIQKGVDIASKTRTAKAVVYRTLKTLQIKGFVESTLESPVRFKAVPFESILNSEIKARHEEAFEIENSKKNLMSDWEKISKSEPALQIEKFVTIEGNQRIYPKIYEMVKTAKHELSIIATVPGIMRSDRYGITNEIINHPLKKKISFRIITDITGANVNSMRFLKKKLKASTELRAKNPEFGPEPFPRMVIRDQEEILFFISQKTDLSNQNQEDICLCTNCKSLIQTFSVVFEDFWTNSTVLEESIDQVISGKLPPRTTIIQNPKEAKIKYYEVLNSAKKEVLIVTSYNGLREIRKQELLLKHWFKKGIATKIMTPITIENLDLVQQLLQWCDVKHIPLGYFETTVVDEQHLFQFKTPSAVGRPSDQSPDYENTYYTNNSEYIQKTKDLLYDIWKKTRVPLSMHTESTDVASKFRNISTSLELYSGAFNKRRAVQFLEDNDYIKVNEKDVLAKINELKENLPNLPEESKIKYMFCITAFGIIFPPPEFNLPKLLIQIFKHDKDSSFGAESGLMINILNESNGCSAYVPAAYVVDNPSSIAFRKKVFEGIPVAKNIQLLENDQLKVMVHGNTLFAGWTKPIPLLFTEQILPPCSIMFEGYGDVRSGMFKSLHPSGRVQEVWFNSHEAFVSFFHPKSKYFGAGTEGILDVNSVFISYPPEKQS